MPDGPDNIPWTRPYEGDLNTVMRILDGVREKMAQQGVELLNISRDVHDLQVHLSQYRTIIELTEMYWALSAVVSYRLVQFTLLILVASCFYVWFRSFAQEHSQ